MIAGSVTAVPAPADSELLSRVYKSNRNMGGWIEKGCRKYTKHHGKYSS
jgi:hypothetical protein